MKLTRILILSACVALMGALGLAALGFSPTLSRVFPEVTLQAARSFDGPAIGLAGEPSPYGVAVAELAERRDAAAFERLLRRDSPVQQLYGLAGLYLLDRERYEAAAAPLRLDNARLVKTRGGCIVSSWSVGFAVAQLEVGEYHEAYVSGHRGEW